jgi:hypothetical protein
VALEWALWGRRREYLLGGDGAAWRDRYRAVRAPMLGVSIADDTYAPRATVEALLFLSADPLTVAQLAEACEAGEGQVEEALSALEEDSTRATRGVVLRRIAGGYTLASAPAADPAARKITDTAVRKRTLRP